MFGKVAFDPQLLPPSHMPIMYGPVKSRKAKAEASQKDDCSAMDISRVCAVCQSRLSVCLLVSLLTPTQPDQLFVARCGKYQQQLKHK